MIERSSLLCGGGPIARQPRIARMSLAPSPASAPLPDPAPLTEGPPPDAPMAIVLAAGKGTRMESELPKVLVPVAGRPMVRYVVDALREAGVQKIVVVVGYKAELVQQELAGEPGVDFALQTEQLGTGHAVMMCRDYLMGRTGPVIIVTGDSPMLQVSSVRSLLDEFATTQPACLLGTAHRDDPTGLGRIVRDSDGKFVGIVEHKDCTPEQLKVTEVNMSTYVFNAPDLSASLDRLTTNNAQGEYYVTDCPGILLGAGKDVRALAALQPCEALSVNTLADLAVVEAEMKKMNKD
ncbi:Bifunctional protein GlmU [Planctomycetes bacterium K2D]|uniref:Bifunctional protein GlmU n=2 Tax=Botrimarina mediterranea TaxID=2528022 RepID=A0A518K424_9BACT|nr:Bifunctional protein GlmU [Botrimarina mediterranea]QDV77114.1 Bifunctional protein GlmU [Planctomycetes bacterium K2D]